MAAVLEDQRRGGAGRLTMVDELREHRGAELEPQGPDQVRQVKLAIEENLSVAVAGLRERVRQQLVIDQCDADEAKSLRCSLEDGATGGSSSALLRAQHGGLPHGDHWQEHHHLEPVSGTNDGDGDRQLRATAATEAALSDLRRDLLVQQGLIADLRRDLVAAQAKQEQCLFRVAADVEAVQQIQRQQVPAATIDDLCASIKEIADTLTMAEGGLRQEIGVVRDSFEEELRGQRRLAEQLGEQLRVERAVVSSEVGGKAVLDAEQVLEQLSSLTRQVAGHEQAQQSLGASVAARFEQIDKELSVSMPTQDMRRADDAVQKLRAELDGRRDVQDEALEARLGRLQAQVNAEREARQADVGRLQALARAGGGGEDAEITLQGLFVAFKAERESRKRDVLEQAASLDRERHSRLARLGELEAKVSEFAQAMVSIRSSFEEDRRQRHDTCGGRSVGSTQLLQNLGPPASGGSSADVRQAEVNALRSDLTSLLGHQSLELATQVHDRTADVRDELNNRIESVAAELYVELGAVGHAAREACVALRSELVSRLDILGGDCRLLWAEQHASSMGSQSRTDRNYTMSDVTAPPSRQEELPASRSGMAVQAVSQLMNSAQRPPIDLTPRSSGLSHAFALASLPAGRVTERGQERTQQQALISQDLKFSLEKLVQKVNQTLKPDVSGGSSHSSQVGSHNSQRLDHTQSSEPESETQPSQLSVLSKIAAYQRKPPSFVDSMPPMCQPPTSIQPPAGAALPPQFLREDRSPRRTPLMRHRSPSPVPRVAVQPPPMVLLRPRSPSPMPGSAHPVNHRVARALSPVVAVRARSPSPTYARQMDVVIARNSAPVSRSQPNSGFATPVSPGLIGGSLAAPPARRGGAETPVMARLPEGFCQNERFPDQDYDGLQSAPDRPT